MKTTKTSFFVVVAAVCGFVFGLYFYSNVIPEPRRELASEKASPAKDKEESSKVWAALKDCMAEQTEDGKLKFTKKEVDGRRMSILSMGCAGDKAKILYEAVAPYSEEQYVRYTDGRRGVARFFGKLYPPSQCARLIRTSRGTELNIYSCSVHLDLDQDLVKDLKI
jgi:hypothetical protein